MLNSDDLPTFGRPTIATTGRGIVCDPPGDVLYQVV
jgi:hypothetical protein